MSVLRRKIGDLFCEKNPYGQNIDTQSVNTSKIPLFRGSFYKFMGIPLISHRKDLEIRNQQPKNLL